MIDEYDDIDLFDLNDESNVLNGLIESVCADCYNEKIRKHTVKSNDKASDIYKTWMNILDKQKFRQWEEFKNDVNEYLFNHVKNDKIRDSRKYLEDMYNDSDKRFFNLFYNYFFPFGRLGDVYFIETTLDFDKKVFIKLFPILCCYNTNKDNFNVLISDVMRAHRTSGNINFNEGFVKRNIYLIESISRYPDYGENELLRQTLIELVSNFNVKRDYDKEKLYDFLKMFFECCDLVGDKKVDSNVSLILGDIFKLSGTKIFPFYSSLFYYGNRYEYMCNLEVEDNPKLKEAIFWKVRELNPNLFEALNCNDEKCEDSFIECMNCVFDSDSYFELFNKLDVLKEAGRLYAIGKEKAAFEYMQDLDSDLYKEIYKDYLVCYPKNSINKIIKPKRIIDRMKALYSRIDSDISYDFMEEIHFRSISVDELMKGIDRRINSPISKVKRKIKRWSEGC